MNLLSGSTWKGAKLRFGEAKPDFKEKCVLPYCWLSFVIRNSYIYICISRIALENKAAAEGPPPRKRRKKNEGSQAEDMSLVTSANVSEREGWQVSSLGRITRPVKMRPEKPLPDVDTIEGERNRKNKRFRDPDSRARRRIIDMTEWGSVHLKGMFLDMPALGMKRLKSDDAYGPTIESEGNEESGDDNDKMNVSQSSERTVSLQTPLSPPLPTNSINIFGDIPTVPTSSIKSQPSVGQAPLPLPDNNADLEVEKTQSLNLLVSLFGDNDDNWVHPESVGSDVDIDELMKGDAMLVDDVEDDGIEVVPIDSGMAGTKKLQNKEREKNEQETENPPARVTSTKSTKLEVQASTKLKDLFAPREEEGKCFQVYCNR